MPVYEGTPTNVDASGNPMLQGGVSNQLQQGDFGQNFWPSFNNAISFDTQNQKLPNGQPASGLASTLGSAAGTIGRDLGGAGVGAAAGSIIPGVGTLAGAGAGLMGAMAEGGVQAERRQALNAGQDPNSLPHVLAQEANAVLPFIPGAEGSGLVGTTLRNAGVQGLAGGAANAVEQGAQKGYGNIDYGQAAQAGGAGALLGGAGPLISHASIPILQRILQQNQSLGDVNITPENVQPVQGPQEQQNPQQAYVSPNQPMVTPAGITPPSELQGIHGLVQQYASYRHFLPQSTQAQTLAASLQKMGIDPNAAADQYLAEAERQAQLEHAKGYQLNLGQSMQNTTQGALQGQAQNFQNRNQAIQGYQPTPVQTPNADMGVPQQQVGPQQEGVHIQSVLHGLADGELDLNDVQEWLAAHTDQNGMLRAEISRMQAANYQPGEMPQTPNADAVQAQDQAALLQAAQQAALFAQDIKARQGMPVTYEDIQGMREGAGNNPPK